MTTAGTWSPARVAAMIALGRALEEAGYAFITVTPATHRRVEGRAKERGRVEARSLRDLFGWSRPSAPALLPKAVLELGREAGVLVDVDDGLLRSTVRFSTLRGRLFAHSAFPTESEDAVFFGPDTYRYCSLVAAELTRGHRIARAVDVGCGAGAGAVIAAEFADRVACADVSSDALVFSEINVALAGIASKVEIVESDVLAGVSGPVDLVIANPPYMVDPSGRAYRDGHGDFGEALGARIAEEALSRLAPGGRLVLYTGSAIVGGVDTFLAAARPICEAAADWRYWEIDPDVFGEEIADNDHYASVDRIAAVALVATARGSRD